MNLKDKHRVIVDNIKPKADIFDPRETVFDFDDVYKAVNELRARVKIGSPSDAKGFRPNESCPKFYDMTKDEVLNAIDEIFGDFGNFENEERLWNEELKLKSEERKMSEEEIKTELDDFTDKMKKAKVE